MRMVNVTSSVDMMPSTGRRTTGRRAVTGNGVACIASDADHDDDEDDDGEDDDDDDD